MVIDEVRRALLRRWHRPTYRWAVLAFYGAYQVAFLSWEEFRTSHYGMRTYFALTPLLLFASFAWLSPMPWQWDGRHRLRPRFYRGLIQAFLFLEGLVLVQVWLASRCFIWAGAPFPWESVLKQNLLVYGPVMIILGCVTAIREAEEQSKDEARVEARIAQTRLLQSQLHPHVLFNALNGLAELIRKDPPSAENSVRSLSDLLRQMLHVSELETIPLAEEKTMVENYLAIESMRLGGRLRLHWQWGPDLDDIEVVPLLLQPLVENAIKHGISPHESGGTLSIRAARAPLGLELEVGNTGEHLAINRKSAGIGLKNLKARLSMAYGEDAEFRIEETQGWVVARILIRMKFPDAAHVLPESRPSR